MNVSGDAGGSSRLLIFWLSGPLSVFIILANLFIILGILWSRKLPGAASSFFLSLLFADLLAGVALPFIPWMQFENSRGYHSCFFTHVAPNYFFLAFLANLLAVHYEKYLCISYPLHYRRFWVHRWVPLCLLLTWTLPLLFACLPVLGWNQWGPSSNCSYKQIFPTAYLYLEIYGFLIPSILAMAFMSTQVLRVARRQLQEIKKVLRSVHQGQGPSELEQQLELRHAKCIASLSLIFLACWVPYVAGLHVSVLAIQNHNSIDSYTVLILTCVGSGSAAVVPIILGLSNRQYTQFWRDVAAKVCAGCRVRCCERGEARRHQGGTSQGRAPCPQAEGVAPAPS
ncbi:G-protein coupled bile acid receptor 1 [Gopherus evgoodei]|uniref:G-protein coupled bile acid receptor 1 n=1 Tax=Gopherus evgoodei TaxID=1825980 RepID=UPI0011CF2F04|nr:G-protein coupled bile acid receptor 1 [Gopherus evgoodei]XP_030436055.1 G-protein coupled bile acid receptor 1 [Gopherus evgoodei]